MNFKDLLDKYKDGNASPEEIKLIEEEINKHEAVKEYLSKSYDIDFENNILEDNLKNETNFIKNKVNKKLRKVIVYTVSVVFSILFTIFYIVSPILNNFYYNPGEKTIGKYNEDLYFDAKVFTELNFPGYEVDGVGSESLGFGVYNIFIERRNSFNRETKYINIKIKRNSRMESFEYCSPWYSSGFYSIKEPNAIEDEIVKYGNQEVKHHINELNPVSYISASVIFQKDLTIKEFDELRKKYNKLSFKWVGVRTESEGKTVNRLFGFNPNLNNGSDSADKADRKKYPYLEMMDWTDADNKKKDYNNMKEAYTKHFTSLLKYMNDRKKAVKALDHNSDIVVGYYTNALDYVQKNGINTYGVLVYGEGRELLQFINNEKIKSISINNVLPSKYINNPWG
ncbi:anti sigma factor C-terminal domain-containing protein [Clostridium lundense]|uniref:anti sigma factor C-terminal domain-containing protein n=1 Tax=Clostridium lundense TaxID=319475 RepID=UPI000482412C|nr:anti sigma factor C-terminal domain-containing protein [Clostridium lundense]